MVVTLGHLNDNQKLSNVTKMPPYSKQNCSPKLKTGSEVKSSLASPLRNSEKICLYLDTKPKNENK